MKAEEAIVKINLIVNRTIKDWGSIMLDVASTANTRLQNRIINTGYNAENRLFPMYTERYRKFKEKRKGSAVTFVDFAFSGRMWSSVQVVSSESEHAKGMARISTLSSDEMKKLSGNTERKGTILDLNEKEVEEVRSVMENRLVQIWHDQGL